MHEQWYIYSAPPDEVGLRSASCLTYQYIKPLESSFFLQD
jgi:hypothetical protein